MTDLVKCAAHWCDTQFIPIARGGNLQKFCSPYCRTRTNQERHNSAHRPPPRTCGCAGRGPHSKSSCRLIPAEARKAHKEKLKAQQARNHKAWLERAGEHKPEVVARRLRGLRKWAESNPDYRKSDLGRKRAALKRIKRAFGLDPQELLAMISKQRNRCASCARPAPEAETTTAKKRGAAGTTLDVDHCHATGKVRALLCGPCNRALGSLGDDPQRIVQLLHYLLTNDRRPPTFAATSARMAEIAQELSA